MGIDYDVVAIFGVSYSYNELENFLKHEETILLADEIGCDDLGNIWSEYGYVLANPYYDADEKDCEYLLGYKLENTTTSYEMKGILEKEEDIKRKIREFSEKYNVVNKENEISVIIRPNIW